MHILYSDSVFVFDLNFVIGQVPAPWIQAAAKHMMKIELSIIAHNHGFREPKAFPEHEAWICKHAVDKFSGTGMLRNSLHVSFRCSDNTDLSAYFTISPIFQKLKTLREFRTINIDITFPLTEKQEQELRKYGAREKLLEELEPTLGAAIITHASNTDHCVSMLCFKFHPHVQEGKAHGEEAERSKATTGDTDSA